VSGVGLKLTTEEPPTSTPTAGKKNAERGQQFRQNGDWMCHCPKAGEFKVAARTGVYKIDEEEGFKKGKTQKRSLNNYL